MTNEELSKIADMVTARTLYATKNILTSKEAAQYLGVSMSYLYHLTMRQEIPYYKPTGVKCYFDKKELEEWIKSNRVATIKEIKDRAQEYCRKGKK